MPPVQGVSRRDVGRLAAGAAIAWSTPGLAAAPGSDLDHPSRRLDAIVKMRGATDGRLAMGWITGQRYFIVGGRATPVFGILASTFSSYRRLDSATFELRTFEVAYFTDLATGKLLERFENPITGKVVDVPRTRMGPSVLKVTAGGFILDGVPSMANLNASHVFRPFVEHGGDVWLTEEIRIFGDPPASGPAPFRYNEMTTYSARRADLDTPGLTTVPTAIQYQSLVGLSPWMGMDGIDGMNMGRGAGRREARLEDMPPYYLELTEKFHPDVLNDPVAVLNGPRFGGG